MITLSPNALTWISLLLKERFGVPFLLEHKESSFILKIEGSESSIKFPVLIKGFYQINCNLPCTTWYAAKEGWHGIIDNSLFAPGVDRLQTPLIKLHSHGATIHYDILGLSYWMLARVEEIGSTNLDNHNRFPATASHAYKYCYLERPIVDEWFDILSQVINKVWPTLNIVKHKFNVKVSHDVDAPSMYSFKSWKSIARMMAGDLLKRRDLKSFVSKPLIKIKSKKGIHPSDPFNTFDKIMKISEKNGLTSAFYFICGRSDKSKDAEYEIEHPLIRKLIQEIHSRGHEIGLHLSYGSFDKPEVIKNEADRLRKLLESESIPYNTFGGRMHFLKWEQPVTMQALEDAGMTYDSTLSYADLPGFRCGTCFEYPGFNHLTQQVLNLRIRPLIVMECTVIDSRYMNLGYTDEALNKMLELKDRCRKVGGFFTLLWHNSHFTNPKDFEIYERVVSK